MRNNNLTPSTNQPFFGRNDKFLTAKQLSEKYQIARQTIYHWVEEKWLAYCKVGKNIFIAESEFLKFMSHHAVDGTMENQPSRKARRSSVGVENPGESMTNGN